MSILSIKTDELKVKPHHHTTVTTAVLILYQTVLFLPLHSCWFSQRKMKQGDWEGWCSPEEAHTYTHTPKKKKN